MKQLIEYIVSNIVNHPENVVISETTADDKGLIKYLIEVNPEDVGRVIGKQGKVIKAIRQIVRIAAIQKGTRAIVDLKEEEGRISQDMGEASEEAIENSTSLETSDIVSE